MTQTAGAYPNLETARARGATGISFRCPGHSHGPFYVFASSRFDARGCCPPVRPAAPRVLMGSSSAGGSRRRRAMGPRSRSHPVVRHAFRAAVGRGWSNDRVRSSAGGESFEVLAGTLSPPHCAGDGRRPPGRATFPASHGATRGSYQFAGGGAARELAVRRPHVFLGTKRTRTRWCLWDLSRKPVGIGVSHVWLPASKPSRDLDRRARVVSLDGLPASRRSRSTPSRGQSPRSRFPLRSSAQHIGIETDPVPLRVRWRATQRSVRCASEIPDGAWSNLSRPRTPISSAASGRTRRWGRSGAPRAALLSRRAPLRMGAVLLRLAPSWLLDSPIWSSAPLWQIGEPTVNSRFPPCTASLVLP